MTDSGKDCPESSPSPQPYQETRLPLLRPITALKYPACLLASLLVLPPAQAESVVCHVTYGGETRLIETQPTTSPYTVPTSSIGTYFLFRVVFRREPADLAGIRIYTYARHDNAPSLLHQASHAYPPGPAANGGFTGLQAVYESMRDSELQYWCELKAGA